MRQAALLVCTLLAAAPRAPAVVQLSGIQFDVRSGISMQLTGYYDNLPKSGYIPLRVTIRNDSTAEHEWTFRFVSQAGYSAPLREEYSCKAAVGGREEKVFELVVPLVAVGNTGHTYPSLQLTVSGYGVDNPTAYYAANYKYSGNVQTPFTGISGTLAVNSWGPLENELSTRGFELTGCRFDLDYLSSDWRAYIGFASIWLTESDWEQMATGERVAMLEWVAHGGRLLVCTQRSPDDPMLARRGLPPGDGRSRAYGLGFVELAAWNGSELDPAVAANEVIRDDFLTHANQLDGGYGGGWRLRTLVSDTKMNSPLIVIAMIGFALLVGPVNLVVFAGKRRRHRLFLTTPLISIAASFALVALILVQDGIGGDGGRVALKYLLPDAHQEMTIQEQVSRTGVLPSSRFDLAEANYLSLINLPQGAQANRGRNLVRTENTAEGDWFTSRAVQAQYLARIVPSRARIELLNPAAGDAGEEAPVLLSSLDQPLRDVAFIDHQGEYWSAPSLPVGVRTALVRQTRSDFRREWWARNVDEPGLHLAGLSDRLAFRAGHVYGVAENPAAGLIETHGKVRWEREHLVVAGPVVSAGEGS